MKTRRQRKLPKKKYISRTKLVKKDKYIQSGGTAAIDAAKLLKGLFATGKAESKAGQVIQDYIKLSRKLPNPPNTSTAKALLLQVAEKAGDVGLGHELIKSLKKVDLSKVAKEVSAEVPSIFSVSTLREMDTLHSVQGSKARSLWRTSQKQHIRQMGAAELKKRALVKEAEVIAEGVSKPKAWKNIPIDERTGIFTPTEALYYSKNPDKIPKYAFEQGGMLKWRDNIREERLGKVLNTLAFAGIAAVSSAAFALDATYHKMLEDSKKEASNKSDDELKNLSFSNTNIDDTYNLYRLFSFSDENAGFFKILDTLSKTDIVKSDSLFIEPYFEMAGGARNKSPNSIPIEKSNRHQILNYIRRDHRIIEKLKEVSNFFKQKDSNNFTSGDFVKLATVKRNDNKTIEQYKVEYGCLGKDLIMEKRESQTILTFSKVGQIRTVLHASVDDTHPVSFIVVCDGNTGEYSRSVLENSYSWKSLKYKINELQGVYHTIATEKYREFFPNNNNNYQVDSYVKLNDKTITKKSFFGEQNTEVYKNDGCLSDDAIEEYINETTVKITYSRIGKIVSIEDDNMYSVRCGDTPSKTINYPKADLIPLGFPSIVTYKNEANNDFIDALFKTVSEKPLFIDGKETFDKLWEYYSLRKRSNITPEYTIYNLLDKYRNAISNNILKEEIITTLYENVVLNSKEHLTRGIYLNNIFNKNIKQQNSNISKEIHFNINSYFMRDYIYRILSSENPDKIEELVKFLEVFYSNANISTITKLLNTSIDYFEYDIIKSDDEHLQSIVGSKVGNHSALYRETIRTNFKEYYFNICRVYQELIKKCNTSSEAATISSSRVLVEFKKIVNIIGQFGVYLLPESIKKILGEVQYDLRLISVAT